METLITVLICAYGVPCDAHHALDKLEVHCTSPLPMQCAMQAQAALAGSAIDVKNTAVIMQAIAEAKHHE